MTAIHLESFLWYGHSVDPGVRSSTVIDVAALDPSVVKGLSTFNDSVAEGLARLRQVVQTALEDAKEPIVIPLSGGIDSRGLLAAVLERVAASKVHTYTFGISGSLDFEIGNSVALRAGTRHAAFNLDAFRYDFDHLIDVSRRVGSTTLLFHYRPTRWIEREFGTGGTHLNGLKIGYFQAAAGESWPRILKIYSSFKRFTRSLDPLPAGSDPAACLPMRPITDPELLSHSDQLNVFVGSEFFGGPHNLRDGLSYRTPYLEPDWLNFYLYVRIARLSRVTLLKRILERLSPELFAIPTAAHFGLPVTAPSWRVLVRRALGKARRVGRARAPFLPWRASPGSNYLDFDLALRERDDVKRLVRESLADLSGRGIVDWLDLDAIWRRHQRKQANHGDALTMLASLEVNLKVLEGAA